MCEHFIGMEHEDYYTQINPQYLECKRMNKVFTIASGNVECPVEVQEFVANYDNVANLGKHLAQYHDLWQNRILLPLEDKDGHVFSGTSIKPKVFYSECNIENYLPQQLIEGISYLAFSVAMNIYYWLDSLEPPKQLACVSNLNVSWSPKIYLPKKVDNGDIVMAIAFWGNVLEEDKH